MRSFSKFLPAAFIAVAMLAAFGFANHHLMQTGPFAGVKANTGYATAMKENGKLVLSLSDDFVIPDAPAPHWQLVDAKGNVYLLNLLKIKGDKYNKTITVPAYVKNVAKVQIWCAWAEVLLGEASFEKPVN
jgi:hypothetical protein